MRKNTNKSTLTHLSMFVSWRSREKFELPNAIVVTKDYPTILWHDLTSVKSLHRVFPALKISFGIFPAVFLLKYTTEKVNYGSKNWCKFKCMHKNVFNKILEQIKCEPVSYHIPPNIDHCGFYHIKCEPMFLVADNSFLLVCEPSNAKMKPANSKWKKKCVVLQRGKYQLRSICIVDWATFIGFSYHNLRYRLAELDFNSF